MADRAQACGSSFAAFPRHEQEAGSEVVRPGLKPVPMWDSSITGSRCICHVTTPGVKSSAADPIEVKGARCIPGRLCALPRAWGGKAPPCSTTLSQPCPEPQHSHRPSQSLFPSSCAHQHQDSSDDTKANLSPRPGGDMSPKPLAAQRAAVRQASVYPIVTTGSQSTHLNLSSSGCKLTPAVAVGLTRGAQVTLKR